MPRSNRPRRRKPADPDDRELDLQQALFGHRRTERRRDGLWNVQPLAATAATKTYSCPGCGLTIGPGTAHTVTWRADGLLGEADDLAGRRHWHNHCWRIRT